MKLVKLIANLGYGSRKEVAAMFREGRITDADGEVLYADDQVEHARIRIDDEPLDPPAGLVLMLHKPVGYTCSTKDTGRVVYDLLPPRYRLRSPLLSTVGRLDRDTSGAAADDRRRRAAAPDRVAESEAAEGLRGDAGQRPARRRGRGVRQRHADAGIGEGRRWRRRAWRWSRRGMRA